MEDREEWVEFNAQVAQAKAALPESVRALGWEEFAQDHETDLGGEG